MKYQTKPEQPSIVEAILWTGENLDEAHAFITNHHRLHGGLASICVPNDTQFVEARPGEWIVRTPSHANHPDLPHQFKVFTAAEFAAKFDPMP